MNRFEKLGAALAAVALTLNTAAFAADSDLAGGPVGTQDPNTVLGIFEGEGDVLFWFLKDAGSSAKSIRAHIRTAKMGSKNVGDMLGALKKGWLILRDPAKNAPHYVFYDEKEDGVFYIPVAANIEYGEDSLKRDAIAAKDDSLMAVYSDEEKDTVVIRKLTPNAAEIESTSGIFHRTEGRLNEALVYDATSLDILLSDPALKAIAPKLSAGEKTSIRSKMAAFLEDKKNPSIQATPTSGDGFLFKLKEDEQDRVYIYATAGSIKEFPVR